MNDQITLYHYWRSSCSWRVRWALHHKNLPHKLVAVNLLEGEQKSPVNKARNPIGFVPTFEQGDVVLSESLAILEYLEDVYPHSPLLPVAPFDKARVRQLAMTIACGTQPIQNLTVMKFVSDDVQERHAWSRHWIVRGFDATERLLEKYAGSYSFGSQLSHADLCLIPQVYNANRFGLDLGPYPTIRRIFKTCMERQDCQRSVPEANNN